MPGDDLVPDPKCGYTQAITIKACLVMQPKTLRVLKQRAEMGAR